MKFARDEHPGLAVAPQTAAVQRQRVTAGRGRRAHLKARRLDHRRTSRGVERQQIGGGQSGGRVGISSEAWQQRQTHGGSGEQRGVFNELTAGEIDFHAMRLRVHFGKRQKYVTALRWIWLLPFARESVC